MQSAGVVGLGLTASTSVATSEETEASTDEEGGDASASDGSEPTEIDSCTVIDEPGEYELVADLAPDELNQAACIVIDSEDVVFRGNGHTIDVSDTEIDGVVFYDEPRCLAVNPRPLSDYRDLNAVVEDVVVRGGRAGIEAQVSQGGTYRDVTAVDNGDGFYFYVDGGVLQNCVAEGNQTGVKMIGDPNVLAGWEIDIEDCTLRNNAEVGLWVGEESTATVSGSRLSNNGIGVRTIGTVTSSATLSECHICGNEHLGADNGTDGGFDDGDESSPPQEGRIDATDCWWGASNGPSSFGNPEEPFTDPETGRPADGDGDAISQSLEPGVSNVRFDPFREVSIDGVGADR